MRKRVPAKARLPSRPVPVTYRYAFNTPEEVKVLVNYYATLMHGRSGDEVIKYANRIKFLEDQLIAPKLLRLTYE